MKFVIHGHVYLTEFKGLCMTRIQWNWTYMYQSHRCRDGLRNRLLRRRWEKTSKLRVNGLCGANLFYFMTSSCAVSKPSPVFDTEYFIGVI